VPIRIYALAKQLKLDSKVLVDICTKAGVTGKGSALASLTDEEMEKVTAYINSGKAGRSGGAPRPSRGGEPAAQPTVFRREDYISPTGVVSGKIPTLPPLKPAKPSPPAPEKTVAAEPPPPEHPASDAPTPPTPPVPAPSPPAPERPVIKPAASASPAEKPKPKPKPKPKREKEARGPAIKLAPLPPASKRPLKPKTSQPAPMKPDIKLPLDAIRAGRAGSKPLSEHLRKHEEKRAAAEAAKTSPRKESADKKLADDEKAPGAGRGRARKGGRGIPEPEADAPALGGREQRQLKRKKAATSKRRKTLDEEETPTPAVFRKRTRIRRTGTNTAAPRRESVTIMLPCTVRSFSEAIGVPARTILGKLLELGTMSTITATLEADTAELLAAELGADVKFQHPVDIEEQVIHCLEAEDDPDKLLPRPPIVTFLGHVDHGKTSLLDKIIGIDVVKGEKGGITQHIRAYRVDKDDRAVTFVDTPGHEAFTEMRARGANVTDIAVLVVAADDGIMPQTEEAISHARAAGVPIVVALNKIDLPSANPQRALEQLAANELLPSEWGGETEVVQTSATTGSGIDALMDTLLTMAELQEYKAAADRAACGTCLESELHEDRGVVAKLLVRKGTLRVGDVLVCGASVGRVKAMYDTLDQHKKYESAGPSTPVNVTGLDAAPGAGDRFYVLEDISQARQLAERRAAGERERELGCAVAHVTLENLYERLGREGKVRTLNIILRADVRGSIEAIRKELLKLEHPEVQLKVLQATVGGISEADVHLAHASDAVIIGFSVVPDEGARNLAEKLGVQIRRYDIIYQITDDLKAALEGMLAPEKQERELGRALVQQTFHISRLGTAAGCRVLSGTILRDARARLIRENRVIGDYALDSLKREKDDAREVREGMECGIKLAGFNDVKEGDLLEVYKIEEIARKF